jgi:hypothetical protein
MSVPIKEQKKVLSKQKVSQQNHVHEYKVLFNGRKKVNYL